MDTSRIAQIYLLAALLVACLCALSLGQTNNTAVILHDQPTDEWKAYFIEESETLVTNAALELVTCPVLYFDSKVFDGFDVGYYVLYSTDSLTNNWTALGGMIADGRRFRLVDDEIPEARFYVLETRQYVFLEIPTNQPPITNAVSAPVALPPIPAE